MKTDDPDLPSSPVPAAEVTLDRIKQAREAAEGFIWACGLMDSAMKDGLNVQGALSAVIGAYHNLQVALAAQPVREPMWQPIETAPKDGTSVILFGDARWPAGVCPAHQDVIGAVGEGYFSGGFWQFMGMIGEPTHWLPLPAAPGITKE